MSCFRSGDDECVSGRAVPANGNQESDIQGGTDRMPADVSCAPCHPAVTQDTSSEGIGKLSDGQKAAVQAGNSAPAGQVSYVSCFPQDTQENKSTARTASSGPAPTPELAPHHLEALRKSGLSDSTIAARGYRTVTKKAELERLGFSSRQANTPTMLVPIWNVAGEIGLHQHRPDRPRAHDGKPVKYETPKGASMIVDCPPAARPYLRRADVPLFITEGCKKADAGNQHGLVTIALLGVWNWRNKIGVLPDWELIALADRRVYIVFDSDVMTKHQVAEALKRLQAFLALRKADVWIVYLPSVGDGGKVGLDDYLTAGNTADDLLTHATREIRDAEPVATEEEEEGHSSYFMTATGAWHFEGQGRAHISNFACKVDEEICRHDGTGEIVREVSLTVTQGDRTERHRMVQSEFAAMQWPGNRLPTSMVVFPGYGQRDHLHAAIKLFSTPTSIDLFTHTGWHQHGEHSLYLHAGGAIWPNGIEEKHAFQVELSRALSPACLPEPPADVAELRADFGACLGLLDCAPRSVMWALVGAAFAAVVRPQDFTVWLHGPTGCRKTALAAAVQALFGAGFDEKQLPGNWNSTSTAVMDLLFESKDMLVVGDDAVPADHSDPERFWGEVNKVVRAQGNRAPRSRCGVDGRRRPDRPPRCTLLATSEEIPRVGSILARLLCVPLHKNDVNLTTLTEVQGLARDGVLSRAMSGYLSWLAVRIRDVQRQFQGEVGQLRDELRVDLGEHAHGRVAPTIASLLIGLRYWLSYGVTVQAIDQDERDRLLQEARAELVKLARRQAVAVQDGDVALTFLRNLADALAAGQCHLRAPDGEGVPEDELALGWRREDVPTRDGPARRIVAKGKLVGWRDGDRVYLMLGPALAEATALAKAHGATFTVSKPALLERLDDLGCIVEKDRREDQGRRTARKHLDGGWKNVVALSVGTLLGDRHESSSVSCGKQDTQDTSSRGGLQPAVHGPCGASAASTTPCPASGSQDTDAETQDTRSGRPSPPGPAAAGVVGLSRPTRASGGTVGPAILLASAECAPGSQQPSLGQAGMEEEPTWVDL